MRKNTKNKNKTFIFVFTTLIPVIIFILVFWFLFLGVKSYLTNSSYFRVKKISFNGLQDESFAKKISKRFLYENIFELNLKQIKSDLRIENPDFYDVEVIKNFPDQIIVNIIKRRPLAQVSYKGYYLIDSEGVIVSGVSSKPLEDLVIIEGLKGISKLSFGIKLSLEQIQKSLELIKLLNSEIIPTLNTIADVKSTKISLDINKYPSIFVKIFNLELRFHSDFLVNESKSFMTMLPSLSNKINQVRYIDLRYDEPAVSFRK